VGVALEEVDETCRWLRLLKATGCLEHKHTAGLLREAGELRAILWATHETAKKNRDHYRRQGR
jgi:hypothetical protein